MEKFQEKFIEIIIPVFEDAIEERKKYYLENPKPEKEHIENIINSCSNTNGAISSLSGMLPGIAGLIAIVPELKATVENQIIMIYDIGVAHGKEEHLSKEIVLSLAMQSGIGSAGINALTRQGEKILIKKASVKVFQKLAEAFGVKLSASIIKSAVAKFVPVLGGVAIGIWVKYTTTQMGETSAMILGKDLDIQETDDFETAEEDPKELLEVTENKVLVLLNLMKADGNSNEKEKEYIKQIIENFDFGFYTKSKFRLDLELSSPSEVDFNKLKKAKKSEKDGLLIDMLTLAKRDGNIHAKEFEYIMFICEQLGLDSNFAANELA
jgi:hypothetical protein